MQSGSVLSFTTCPASGLPAMIFPSGSTFQQSGSHFPSGTGKQQSGSSPLVQSAGFCEFIPCAQALAPVVPFASLASQPVNILQKFKVIGFPCCTLPVNGSVSNPLYEPQVILWHVWPVGSTSLILTVS